jgi:substrate import-associated zinc metallohydrolase lipoprotein
MKRLAYILTAMLAAAPFLVSCEQDNPDRDNSIIVVNKKDRTPFDDWLDAYFVHPYNIQFKYRYQMDESTLSYTSIPADYNAAIMMAHIVKFMCIDTYDEVAGIDFTRRYFPKMFFLMGEWEYKNNGTMILGTAESGRKIKLAGINYLPGYARDPGQLNHYYLKTIHHEFTHILNQTKDFPVKFSQITPESYVTDSWNDTDSDYLRRGFISKYSQHSDREDFAEMMSMYITNSPERWESWLNTAGDSGRSFLESKLDIVRDYMDNSFGIDLDELRSVILRREEELASGQVDIESLDIK